MHMQILVKPEMKMNKTEFQKYKMQPDMVGH